MRIRYSKLLACLIVAGLVILVGGFIWWKSTHRQPKLVYTSQGFGGLVAREKARPGKTDPLQPAKDAYNAGKFRDAEVQAQRVIGLGAKSGDPGVRKKAVEARNILAFSAARRKDLRLARERFAVLESEALKLPDKGTVGQGDGGTRRLGRLPSITSFIAIWHAVLCARLFQSRASKSTPGIRRR